MNLFREAIAVLEQDGWVKGAYSSPEGVCLTRAITLACGGLSSWREQTSVLEEIIEQFPDRFAGNIERFNDHIDTTLDDVVLVLEKVAVRWDEQNG